MSKASLWIGSRLRSLRQALLGLRCRLVDFGLSSAKVRKIKDFSQLTLFIFIIVSAGLY